MSLPHDPQLRRQTEALRQLTRSEVWRHNGRDAAIREVAAVAAETLEVARVGVWLFDEDRSAIVCELLFDAVSGATSRGQVVRKAECPAYFAALESSRCVSIANSQEDWRVAELRDSYLTPLGVGALLDAPVLAGGRCAGVVCHEHLGEPRSWSAEDEAFAGSIADAVARLLLQEEQREARERLFQREEDLRLALDAADMGVWRWEVASNTLEWSDRVGAMLGHPLGWTPTDPEAYLDLVHPDDRAAYIETLSEALASCQSDIYLQHRVLLPGDRLRWIESRGRIERDDAGQALRISGTIADITERKGLEEQLLQAQKMEAVGRLAGGIAHDFNNLLTVISGYLGLLQRQVADDLSVQKRLDEIRSATDRASELTGQLLAFARKQPVKPQLLDLNSSLRGLESLLKRLIGEDVRIRLELCESPARIRIDPSRFEQVVLNLAVNARDAMPQGGELRLRSQRVARPSELRRRLPGCRRGLRLDVSDTGKGMDASTAARIFEPFFTTKPSGSGTGLGLATCYGIIAQAGGVIEVWSEPGRGATFSIWFPERDAAESEPAVPRRPSSTIALRKARILVVEDDDSVRSLIGETLSLSGITVTLASSGQEALDLLARAPADLVLTDLVMPSGSGRQLYERLTERYPELPVVFMSGYSDQAVDAAFGAPAGAPVLSKPFDADDLLRFIREQLNAGAQDGARVEP